MKRNTAANSAARKRSTAAKPQRPRKLHPRAATASGLQSLDALAAAGAQALGIPLDPSWQQAVTFNLALILSHAAKVEGFALPDDVEPAPIFHA